LRCLSFHLRILITPLVSSNSSWAILECLHLYAEFYQPKPRVI
jgi:hypothetical protein